MSEEFELPETPDSTPIWTLVYEGPVGEILVAENMDMVEIGNMRFSGEIVRNDTVVYAFEENEDGTITGIPIVTEEQNHAS